MFLLFFMAACQDFQNFCQGMSFGHQQYEVVVQEIGCLIEKKIAIVVFGFYDQFDCFLAYFLSYFVDPFVKQPCGIGVFCGMVFTVEDDLLDDLEEIVGLVDFVKTGVLCAKLLLRLLSLVLLT